MLIQFYFFNYYVNAVTKNETAKSFPKQLRCMSGIFYLKIISMMLYRMKDKNTSCINWDSQL